MICAALLLLQSPETAALQRKLRAGEKRGYRVELTTETEDGATKSQYRLELRNPKTPPDAGPWPVAGELRDLEFEVGEKSIRKRGSFGELHLDFAPTGLPGGITFEGNSPFMFPLLAWYLPDEIGKDGTFIVERLAASNYTLTGTGTEAREGKRTRVTSSLRFQQGESEAGTMTMNAFFDARSGVLVEAEGSAQLTLGKITFRVR